MYNISCHKEPNFPTTSCFLMPIVTIGVKMPKTFREGSKKGWCLAPIDPASSHVLHDSLSDLHECTRNFAELSIMPRVGGPDLAHWPSPGSDFVT